MSHEINKDQDKKFSLSERLKSLRYVFHGIITLIRNEHNFRIHLFILFIVVLAAIIAGLIIFIPVLLEHFA